MGASLWWVRSHREEFRKVALQGLLNDFQSEKEKFLAGLPEDLQVSEHESWSLEFMGDELWISAPSLLKKMGSLTLEMGDFDRARQVLISNMKTEMAKRPGDDRRFPIKLRFRNEPEATPSPTPAI